jgi:predicted Fe-Mo cluster-binding NifX family protein
LLVPRLGENAAGVIRAANIKIYKTTNDSINDNINAFIDEKLNPLEDIHPGFHGRGGNM